MFWWMDWIFRLTFHQCHNVMLVTEMADQLAQVCLGGGWTQERSPFFPRSTRKCVLAKFKHFQRTLATPLLVPGEKEFMEISCKYWVHDSYFWLELVTYKFLCLHVMGTEKSHKISGDPSIDSKVKGLHPSSSTGFFFRVLTSRSVDGMGLRFGGDWRPGWLGMLMLLLCQKRSTSSLILTSQVRFELSASPWGRLLFCLFGGPCFFGVGNHWKDEEKTRDTWHFLANHGH